MDRLRAGSNGLVVVSLALVGLAVGPVASEVRACVCRADPGLFVRVASCEVVFRGTCLGVERVGLAASGELSYGNYDDYRFAVEHAWWGSAPETLHVITLLNSCSAHFDTGIGYLVFGRAAGGRITTGQCLGNARCADATADLPALDAFERLGDEDARAGFLIEQLSYRLETIPNHGYELALIALKRFPRYPDRVVPALLRAIDESGGFVWCGAIEAFGSYPSRINDFLPLLRQALREREGCGRLSALRALEALGPAAAPCVPDLVRLRRTADAGIRWRVEALLKRLQAPGYPPAGARMWP